MKLAVVGVTGMVGQVMLKVLEERNFPITELIPVASEKSVGKKIQFKGKEYTISSMQSAVDAQVDIALFSAGGSTSLEWAPKFAEKGTFVIDNSSAWRMDPNVPLVVPEINANAISEKHKIIANPNCSTIQLVMAMYPLHQKYQLKRMVVSTYQSVSGTGKAAVDQLNNEMKSELNPNGSDVERVYPYQIFKNALPHCDDFSEENYTKEEWKLMREPKKIMGTSELKITATAVRIPVQGGHSESVNATFGKAISLDEVKQILSATSGVALQDNVAQFDYPMCYYSEGKDDVFVGRIRRDFSQENTLNLWIVADNLRKGAATNAVQIAEYLVEQKWC